MIAAHQVWSSLPTAEDITVHLSEDVASALLADSNLEDWINRPNQADLQSLSVLSPLSVQWLQQLNASPGALRVTTGSHYSESELRRLYAVTSRALGWINNRYTYFFDVMDRGLDYTKEAIPVSKTKAETGYHTDSTAKHYFPDIIGLLCLQPAKSGGESLITNAANLFQHITNEHSELKDLLHQAWCREDR